ncbi:hypothetical protein A4X06_0g9133 [Tilletia controversa]|uniref:Uncharacterized protein n=3 Tax=Tilletia TaxID=13289 RepID=A0A8X7SSL1_9BASI|nr:hypothetical protein A4X06_0g9133 [Tilletia controversa]
MDAHGVFLPTKSAQERQDAWIQVAADVNRWAEEAEDATCANRSPLACENQWRKVVHKKFKEGQKMSAIATGPSEKTDEEWQPVLVSLSEQWDGLVSSDISRKEGKEKATKERQRGPAAASAAAEDLGELEGVDDDDEEDALITSTGKARTKQKGSALLASTMGSFVTEQGRNAEAERTLRTAQHQESLDEAREAREERQRQHRENRELEERRVALEEERVRKETELQTQLGRMEQTVTSGLAEMKELIMKHVEK